MNYLSVENLSKNFGEKILFEKLQFGLSKGDKTALIAHNGTGKSTMLKIIAGFETPDEGKVVIRNGVRVGYLEQEPVLNDNFSINDFIAGGNTDIYKAIKNYEEALKHQSENYNNATHKAFEEASSQMDEIGAWDYERRMNQILTEFGFLNSDQQIASLSGGERKRLALAQTLIDNPELLILDEPTNHLDITMIEWLEKYLMQNNITVLMVTHDRYFLERICNHILELENEKLYRHKGNYQYFLKKRAEREAVFETDHEKARQFVKKELDWIRRAPKARTSKSKSRIDAFYETQEKLAGKKPDRELKLEVKMSRIGGKILELENISKSYHNLRIIKNFSHVFKKSERLGILGKNGVGKSTLLNIITGSEPIDSGKIKTGQTISFGHYKQQGIKLKSDKRVIDVLKAEAEVISLANGKTLSASQFLEYFMFPVEMQYNYVSKLSGGERRRLALLMVLIKNPNFLILDEPTNDLDLFTLNKLEDFLQSYCGCLVIVSHDRYFMDKLVDHYFTFEGNGVIKDHNGTYSEYRDKTNNQEDPITTKDAKIDKPKTKNKTSLSYKERQEYNGLETEIEGLESEKKELENFLNSGITDYEVLREKGERIQEVIDAIDEKTMRWLELDELA